jgi:hypothetical protein
VALSEAVHIARKRGGTQAFVQGPGTICNFVIYCPDVTAHIRIKRVTRVHCSHAWVEGEARDALADLRAIAPGTGISRELWVYLPRGAFRFFRVEENGLIELSRDGTVMPEKVKPVVAKLTVTPPVQDPPAEVTDGTAPSDEWLSPE